MLLQKSLNMLWDTKAQFACFTKPALQRLRFWTINRVLINWKEHDQVQYIHVHTYVFRLSEYKIKALEFQAVIGYIYVEAVANVMYLSTY